MKRLSAAIYLLDLWLLLAAKWCVDLCVEWFSWRQRTMERVLIVVHGASLAGQGTGIYSVFWLVTFLCIMTAYLWSYHRRPDRRRIFELLGGGDVPLRVSIVALTMVCVPMQFLPPVRHRDVLEAVRLFAYLATIYVAALPADDEMRGRKRKAALEKITDQFGRTFVPEGV